MRCKPAISSHSLGRACVHDLPTKLDEAAKYGFAIELFYEDLAYLARTFPGGDSIPDNLLDASRTVHRLCRQRGLEIMSLQPFMHYEGLRDRARHDERIEEMKLWIQIAHILETSIIAIPSSFLSVDQISGDMDLIVSDLRKVADLGAPEGITFGYESLAWGTYANTWEKAWEIVQRVDRPNFGICIDTFNIAARTFADPAAISGVTVDADVATAQSIRRMVERIDMAKLVYVQVVDAERLDAPLIQGHEFYEASQPPRMTWSRNCRLFYGEEDRGAYLPIRSILIALLDEMGFEGYVSAEMFNRSLFDPDPSTPAQHAARAFASWQKIVREFGLETMPLQRRGLANRLHGKKNSGDAAGGSASASASDVSLAEMGPIRAQI